MKRKDSDKIKIWALCFWLLVWQLASMALSQPILLPSPLAALKALFAMLGTGGFWLSIGHSTGRIILGFVIGTVCGCVFAVLALACPAVRSLLHPPVVLIKSTPVVSFIILALVWIKSANLSIFIPALMVFPPVYLNVQEGLISADRKLLEMADVFSVPFSRRLSGIYIPACLPHFRAACSLALGLCWKSGVAAEVIGLPRDTAGFNLYQAKIYLETPELFAWTAVIILISVLFEKLFMLGLGRITDKYTVK